MRTYAFFPRCGVHEGNSNGRIVRHRLVRLAMKLVVAQFWRAKVNEGTECVQSENVMQFSHHHQLAMSLWLRIQSLCRCITGQ